MPTKTHSSWTLAALTALPPVIPAATADEILGISHSLGKNLRATRDYPVRILPGLGRSHKISLADLLAYLGLPEASGRADHLDGTLPSQQGREEQA